MNDNTRGQWERHIVASGLKMTDRFVLYWLVNDHSAAEGFSRPGLRRLERMTGATRETLIESLARLVEHGSIRLHRRGKGQHADEYVIPWLRNRPSAEVGNPTANPTANPTSSSPLRGEQRGAPRKGGAHAAEQHAGDAADDPDAPVCARCERPLDALTECPTAGVDYAWTKPCHLERVPLRLVGGGAA